MSILDFNEQNEIKPISLNNDKRYYQIAKEVESLELEKMLGCAFAQDVIDNYANYTDLLQGSEFTDVYGNIVSHKGLKYVLAFLNYSRYVGESYISDTFTGMVKKTRQDSETISSGDIRRLQQDAREIAMNAFELIRMYLNNNKETYPLWNQTSDKKVYKPKFYGIKTTEL